ncbi:hypothetical protein HOE37_05080 [Candidatus Woesearchaeota archaeon]|jgi:hypothetical protein|nr:hypothetical protein [Candidatus Woesearchaeota archaeon]MBT4111206.1 hypothetical protein [Candidatus Woesearchaeota archaeon]MBT4336786.1 hypothetical protein [Candidatus Woesearchaeota archaeon]MBT4469454.1 hypothetical protein [Candidatus Woesearchaeota archaeon]MBT6744151.1 hypothetical protein [Candidatus Woesearchaeota archaeon]
MTIMNQMRSEVLRFMTELSFFDETVLSQVKMDYCAYAIIDNKAGFLKQNPDIDGDLLKEIETAERKYLFSSGGNDFFEFVDSIREARVDNIVDGEYQRLVKVANLDLRHDGLYIGSQKFLLEDGLVGKEDFHQRSRF